jgi:microcystin-dependent protein
MEPFLGQIELLPFTFAPEGWATCEGQLLSIGENTALFSLLGTYFGGDGQTSFALPDLRNKEPTPNTHYCIALQGIYPSRS